MVIGMSFSRSFLSAIIILFSAIGFAVPSTGVVRPTWGGAQYGYEATLEQQLDYLEQSLPIWLVGWGLKMVKGSLSVDSRFDIKGEPFHRYYNDSDGAVHFYPFVLRTAYFVVANTKGQKLGAAIYFVEQVGSLRQPLRLNSTVFESKIKKSNSPVRWALVGGLSESDFVLELDRRSLQLMPAVDLPVKGASSTAKVQYVKKQLQDLLPPEVTVDYHSLHIDDYYDFNMVLDFKTRFGHKVIFTARDLEGKSYDGWVTLWESHSNHQSGLSQCNSTLQRVPSIINNTQAQLVLSRGYRNGDLSLEVEGREILSPSMNNGLTGGQ